MSPWLAYEELSIPQLARIDRQRAVVLLPLGPVEEHGPHLPFGVDAFNAEFIAEESARIINEIDPTITVLKIPTLYLGTNVYRPGGSLWVRQRVVRDALIDYGRALADFGWEKLVIISAHGGPRHFVALEEAAKIVSRRRGVSMISLTARIIIDFLCGRFADDFAAEMKTPFTEEEKQAQVMDYHAGWWETSMMLWLKPHLVDPLYQQLPPALVPRHRLRPSSPWTVGPGLGYLGSPARASTTYAQASVAALRPKIKKILTGLLNGDLSRREVRSSFYFIPLLRTNFWRWVWTILGLAVGSAALWWATGRGLF